MVVNSTIKKHKAIKKLRSTTPLMLAVAAASATFLSGCKPQLVAFDPDGVLNAKIRYTEFGVPHIQADNLESLAYGVGYAYAKENACTLADIVLRANSQRARYFGPDLVPGSGDGQHLISDFGYLALDIRAQAEQGIAGMSDRARAMLSGYTKGYNRYLRETSVDSMDPVCAGKPWVKPITDVDMLTALLAIELMPGSAQFLSAMFVAAPPGTSYLPTPVNTVAANNAAQRGQADAGSKAPIIPLLASNIDVALPEKNPQELGSNGWALGKEKSENGRGLLLANPHFPHTGNLRFWQFHTTIPGVMNVMGASLAGAPGIVNVGFNDHLAWTHTFSTAEHAVAYQLSLDASDASGLRYLVDGVSKPVTQKVFQVDVQVAPGVVVPFQKTMYFSDFGPLFVVPGKLPWGPGPAGQGVAYAIKDANQKNFDLIDHWLAMDLAHNMDEFQQAFKDYNGVIFNNTLAVDRAGKAFYIDDSTVPHLTDIAENALRTNPQLIQMRRVAGFSILPGNSSQFDFHEAVPYEKAPKLLRSDFVQNSNDSFWLTNPAQPISDVSILYGKTDYEQTYRSRLGQKMLQDASGSDGRFNPQELESALFSERSLLAEEILPSLVSQCQAQGTEPVVVGDKSVDISPACNVLTQWDGRAFKNSRGVHLFREFAQEFSLDPQWSVPFDPAQPTSTPNTLNANAKVLQQLATAMLRVQSAGIALDAPLGDVQFVERTLPDGTASGERLPWEGGNNIEGGFNVFRPVLGNDGTLIPRHVYAPLPGSQLSAAGKGYKVDYGSSWMMTVNFTERGPVARGLLAFSQSANTASPHNRDQTEVYSTGPELHDLPFREADIASHLDHVETLSEKIR